MNQDGGWPALRQAIGQGPGGTVIGVAAIAPSGARFGHEGRRQFVAASTVKVPLMVELYRQMETGALAPDQRVAIRAEDRSGGSGVLSHLADGLMPTVADLAYLMMSISDNTATNALFRLVGMAQVQARMQALGMAGSTVRHAMRGKHVEDKADENWATPDDYCAAMAAILGGRAASQASCEAMVTLLETQQNDRRIARFLPKEGRPRWGSKTGSLPGVCNDVGFVTMEDGALVLAIFIEDAPDPHAGEALIGALARAAMTDAAGAQR